MTTHRIARPHPLTRFGFPLALLVAVVGGASLGLVLRDAEEPTVPAVPPNTPATHDPPVPVTPATRAPATSAPLGETVAPPVTAFLDGGYFVSTVGSAGGVTVAPGTYRSVGAAGCAWEHRSGSTIEQDRTTAVVTIRLRAGDFFRSDGCGSWTRAGR